MIDSGRAGVDDETPEGETPVLAAIASNNAVALDLLLNRGAQVNRFSCHGYTPLMKAAAAKSEASVLTLLRHGADLFDKDPHNKIALDWARLANHEGVVQQLELAIHQHNCTRRIDQAKDETQRRNADLLERNYANEQRPEKISLSFRPGTSVRLFRSDDFAPTLQDVRCKCKLSLGNKLVIGPQFIFVPDVLERAGDILASKHRTKVLGGPTIIDLVLWHIISSRPLKAIIFFRVTALEWSHLAAQMLPFYNPNATTLVQFL
ncbi:hypothetical protein LEN26_005019 [Aphanomyces euteiches]|nr:hypothetical protein LEN26_005019 [Aphanomyces euteiches]